jgi:hypothetical protein
MVGPIASDCLSACAVVCRPGECRSNIWDRETIACLLPRITRWTDADGHQSLNMVAISSTVRTRHIRGNTLSAKNVRCGS